MSLPRRRGFTLIELLVALTIGSMVVAAVVAVLTSANRTQRVGESRADLLQSVRVAVGQLERDLQLAVTRSNDESFQFVGENADLNELPMDTLEFSTVAGDPLTSLLPTGDQLRVQWGVDTDGRTDPVGLVRTALSLPLLDETPPEQQELAARVYCPWAVGLGLMYYDPQQEDWVEEWTDRTDLPGAVRVTLYVVPGLDEEADLQTQDALPFSTVVRLSLAEAPLGGAATGGGTGAQGPGAGGPGAQAGEPTLPTLPGMPNLPGLTDQGEGRP